MIRYVIMIIACFIIAGIVHIGSILYVSTHLLKDFFEQTGQLGGQFAFHILPPPTDNIVLKGQDPNMTIGVCQFSLAQKPLQIIADLNQFEWSMALYTRQGFVYYSLNNRGVVTSQLNAIIYTDDQMNMIEQTSFSEQNKALLIEAPEREGLVLLRILTSSEGERTEIKHAIETALCKQMVLQEKQPLQDDRELKPDDDNTSIEPQLPPSRPND